MLKRASQGFVVCLLAVMMLGAGDAESRFNKIGHELMCSCGCGQILLECNHVSCPASPVMISELRGFLNSGADGSGGSTGTGTSDTSILNCFAAKYGAIVLAAPIRGGFDNVAWIAPIAVFILATVGTGFLVWMWKLRGAKLQVAGTGAGAPGFESGHDAAMRERIRRETEY
jgi:cytochrome c-type biogenesis protein CcmH/NrfF